jgi:hypothetical protein
MGGGTQARILLEPARAHLARMLRLVRLAVGLGALLGISVSAFAVSGRASATLGSPVTSAFFDSEPGEPLLNGGSITFTSPPPGAAYPAVFYQGGGSSPRFTLFDSEGDAYQIYFAPQTTQAGLVPGGVYEDAQFTADATHPELFIDRGGLDVCPSGTGRFIVDDLTLAPGGALQTFSVRFEEHCNDGNPALFGTISYNSTADYRTRTVSPTSLSLATTGSTPTSGHVTITDNGPSALTPSGFSISGADASHFAITGNTCTNPLAAGVACTVTVTYTPGATPSEASATLNYYDELSPQGPPNEPDTLGTGRDIPLTGTDTPPLVASTSNLGFGEATLGTYVGPMSVVVSNRSTSVDEFNTNSDFVFSGIGANDYEAIPDDTCPTSVDTVRLNDVYFAPGTLGSRPATFSIDDTLNSGVSVALSGTGGIGYYQVDSSGNVATAGDAGYFGDAGGAPLNKPIVGMAATGDNGGYWLVASDGGIFAYGDAGFYGSTGAIHLNKPIVGMAPTPDGNGYWLVASDGGIFSYGDAGFYGSTGAIHLNKPIVGMAPTPDGNGYWLVASDGGIFAYGDAGFYGSAGSIRLTQPIVAMAAMPTGGGYWFSAADGGLFNYGDAPFYGSGVGTGLGTVVAMASDGEPTLQAIVGVPAIRQAHVSGLGPAARRIPRFSGP